MEKLFSVICPVYNEKDYINELMEFFIKSPPEDKELLIIDGGSRDGTQDVIKKWMLQHKNIFLLTNDKKYVPYALNMAIKQSSGKYIVRVDAHSKYADDYLVQILETFKETNADIVGGPTRVLGRTDFQKALAVVMCSPFGMGNSKVHDISYNGFSDHVTFGAWEKKLFDEIGMFDEQFVRNQDDEFHYRAKSKGKKIYLNSSIKLWYFPRRNILELSKQYFQYGLYKPLVLRKIKSEIKTRHIIPSIFLLYLITIPFVNIYNFEYLPLSVYLLMLIVSFITCKLTARQRFYTVIIYPTIHLSYGLGFICGILKLFDKKGKNGKAYF